VQNRELFKKAFEAHEKEKFNEALELYLNCLNSNFNDPELLHYLGTLMFQMGYNGGAANILARAIQCKSENIDSMVNLGAAYYKEWDFEGSREIWNMALEKLMQAETKDWPAIVGLLTNIGGIGVHAGDYAEAVTYYKQALDIDATNEHAQANMGLANLALGNWEEGWQGYEHHLKLQSRRPRTYKGMAIWNGEPNREVIIYGEQGVGDEIMFASMIPDLMKISNRVIFDCHPRLVETFKRSFGIECYGTRKTDQCTWFPGCGADSVAAIGSLGKFFRNSHDAFPGTPFIKPRAMPKSKSGGKLRVGLSWRGGVKSTGDRFRSIQLEELTPLIKAFPDIDWVSLQYHTDSSRVVLEAKEKHGIDLDHKPGVLEGFDYDATLDLVAGLDLVISVPTTVVHAAGSMGVPCWVMVQKQAAWRETGNCPTRGPDMAWYNSVKLFHRNEETWDPLIMRIINELSDFAALHRTERIAA
jgi:tetratricopeptide (TPR) repeat protein